MLLGIISALDRAFDSHMTYKSTQIPSTRLNADARVTEIHAISEYWCSRLLQCREHHYPHAQGTIMYNPSDISLI